MSVAVVSMCYTAKPFLPCRIPNLQYTRKTKHETNLLILFTQLLYVDNTMILQCILSKAAFPWHPKPNNKPVLKDNSLLNKTAKKSLKS